MGWKFRQMSSRRQAEQDWCKERVFYEVGLILEKDIVSLDLRMPDRVVARLSADAAAARDAALAKKPKKKGAQT